KGPRVTRGDRRRHQQGQCRNGCEAFPHRARGVGAIRSRRRRRREVTKAKEEREEGTPVYGARSKAFLGRWCTGGESNPYALRRWNLNPVRLPVSPPVRGVR